MLRASARAIGWMKPMSSALRCPSGGHRCMTVRFDADDQEVADNIDKHLDRSGKGPQQVSAITVQREALSLYRDILRYSRLFVWNDEKGQNWSEVIQKSARQEFEAARFEKDPELIARMLLVGRESLDEVKAKFLNKRQAIIEEEDKLPPEQRGGPGSSTFKP